MKSFYLIIIPACIFFLSTHPIVNAEKISMPPPADTFTGTQFMGGPFRRGMDCDKQPPLAKRWPWTENLKSKFTRELEPQLSLLNKNRDLVLGLANAVNAATNRTGRAELIRFKGTADLWYKALPNHPIRSQEILDGHLNNIKDKQTRQTCRAILLSPFDHVDMLKEIGTTKNLQILLADIKKTISENKHPLFKKRLLKMTQPPMSWRSVPFEIGIGAGYAQPIVANGKVYFCTLGPKFFRPNTDVKSIQSAIEYARSFNRTVPDAIKEKVIRKRALNTANLYGDIVTDEFSNIIGQPLKPYKVKKWINSLGNLDDNQKTFILKHLCEKVPTINIHEALEAEENDVISIISKLTSDRDHYDWAADSNISERTCMADFLISHQPVDHLKVHCLDFASGNLLWTKTFPSIGKDTNGGCGTPAYWQGRIYIHTKAPENHNDHSVLMCLDAESGKQIWQTSLKQHHLEERGFLLIRDFPISNSSPLVFNNIVCVQHRGLSALDAKTGMILWQEPALGQQFSTPTAYSLEGEDYALVRTRTTGKRVRQWVGIHGMNQHLNHLPFKGGHPIDYLFSVHLRTGQVKWGISYQDNTRDYDTLTTWQTDQGVVTFDDFMRPMLLTQSGPVKHPIEAYQYVPKSGMRLGVISDLRQGAELIHQYGGWGRDATVWWWMYYSLRLEKFNHQAGKWELASQYQMPPVFAYPNPTLIDGKCIIRMADGRLSCYDLRQKPSE